MTTFDEREHAFENKFIHDEELKFRCAARRNKLTGLWAAGLLGKSGDAAAAYAKEIVAADMAEAGDEDVVRKLAADLAGKAGEAEIRAKLSEFMAVAKRQVMEES